MLISFSINLETTRPKILTANFLESGSKLVVVCSFVRFTDNPSLHNTLIVSYANKFTMFAENAPTAYVSPVLIKSLFYDSRSFRIFLRNATPSVSYY